jgi:hypothetical protein
LAERRGADGARRFLLLLYVRFRLVLYVRFRLVLLREVPLGALT